MATPHPLMLFNAPLSPDKVDRTLALLELMPRSRVVDVGCGTGELLIRAVERYGVRGVGIDLDTRALTVARERGVERAAEESLEWHAVEASAFPWAEAPPFEAACCIGATHAFGGFAGTVKALQAAVEPGGHVLIGDVYARREPEPEYLALLGEPMLTQLDQVQLGREARLSLLYTIRSSDDEWDHFEGLFSRSRTLAALELPPGPERAERLERAWRWQEGYLRWGCTTMGFALYLFQKAF